MTAESENRNVVPLGRGHFFAVDRRVWARLCEVGINEAVAYLVLARGTLRDMRTTSWSVNAIEDRTNIARHRAKVAIEALLKAGIVRRDKGGFKPRYGHSPRDRSLSVTPEPSAANGFLVHSFAGDDPIVCLDYVRARLGVPAFTPQGGAPPRKPAAGAHQALARHDAALKPEAAPSELGAAHG